MNLESKRPVRKSSSCQSYPESQDRELRDAASCILRRMKRAAKVWRFAVLWCAFWGEPMKAAFLVAAMIGLCGVSAMGHAKADATDPMTKLPVISAVDSLQPDPYPSSQVCKSKLQGEFYTLSRVKIDAAVAWYASHLNGFAKVSGYDGQRSQTAFYNADRTVVVILTGSKGAKGENTDAYSVAYQRYQPGLSAKTIAALPSGTIDCRQ
jgi:hypothetical protein